MKVEISPSIDHLVFDRLHVLLKDNFDTALATALDHTKSHIINVADKLSQHDTDSARAQAHKIVSSAGAFGLTGIVTAARAIEYGEAANTHDEWLLLLGELETEFSNIVAFIQKIG